MIITFKHSELRVEIRNNGINYITVENPRFFEMVCNDILLYHSKKESSLLILEGGVEKDIHNTLSVISSPFDISLGKKETQRSLIKELVAVDSPDESLSIENALNNIQEELNRIAILSDYNLGYKEINSAEDLLKLLDVHIETLEEERFVEKMIAFIKASKSLLGNNVYFAINCLGTLDESDLLELNKWCAYMEVTLLFVDPFRRLLPKEHNSYIIDNDMCILH